MIESWYYTHAGQQYGPVSSDEIQSLATRGLLLHEDLLWPEGFDSGTAIEAGAVVVALAGAPRQAPKPEQATQPPAPAPREDTQPKHVTQPPASRPTAKLPDWLDDVRQGEQTAARPQAPEAAPIPAWLSDVRKVEETPLSAPAPVETAVPDWVSGLRRPGEAPAAQEIVNEAVQQWLTDPRRAEEARPTAESVAPAPQAPAAPPALIKAVPPVAPVRPDEPPPRVAVAPVETQPVVEVVPDKTPPVVEVSPVSGAPVARPAADAPAGSATCESLPETRPANEPILLPPPGPAALTVAPTPEETGFNPETGQILDADKFQEWQRGQQLERERQSSAQPAPSVYALFDRARRELKAWVDSAENERLIAQGNVGAVLRHPAVQRLIRTYQPYGQEIERKLWQHLVLLVDNRRKFHASRT